MYTAHFRTPHYYQSLTSFDIQTIARPDYEDTLTALRLSALIHLRLLSHSDITPGHLWLNIFQAKFGRKVLREERHGIGRQKGEVEASCRIVVVTRLCLRPLVIMTIREMSRLTIVPVPRINCDSC
jgi:hypothetical protein